MRVCLVPQHEVDALRSQMATMQMEIAHLRAAGVPMGVAGGGTSAPQPAVVTCADAAVIRREMEETRKELDRCACLACACVWNTVERGATF